MDGPPATGYEPFMGRRTADIALMLAVLATLVVGAIAATGVRMQGDLSEVLEGTSAPYLRFAEFEETFGSVAGDAVLSVRAEDLGREATLTAFEDLLIELQLSDGVGGVISIFSLLDPAEPSRPFLRRPEIAELRPAERLDRLHAEVPLAAEMLSEDRSLTLVTVIPASGSDLAARQDAIDGAIAYVGDEELTVRRVGIAALQEGIAEALARDQLRLTPASMLLSGVLALLLFRSWRAALICLAPAVVSLAWTLGLLAALDIPLDPFLATVPTVLIVLAFADAVHLYHAIAVQARTLPLDRAVARALAETWPAILLTTLTTALAFLSLLLVGSPTLRTLALVGAGGLGLVFVAVFATMPVLARLMLQQPPRLPPVQFRRLTRAAAGLLPRYRVVAVIALALLAALAGLSVRTTPGYDISNHVPRGSDFAEAVATVEESLPGSDRLHVIVTAADPAPGLQPGDRARIAAAARAIYGAPMPVPDTIDTENPLTARFLAADGSAFSLPVAAPLGRSGTAPEAVAEQLAEALDAAGLSEVVEITGYSLMTRAEVARLIHDLRSAFYLAVIVVAALAAVLSRSLRLAAASFVPNLIPILGVEAWLVLTGQHLTLTGAIALTVAFGIAVDDTIHLLNRHRIARAAGSPDAIGDALEGATPPVVMTSLILVAGFTVSMFSLLPSIGIFATLVTAAVVLACLADLFLFPSLLAWAAPERKPR